MNATSQGENVSPCSSRRLRRPPAEAQGSTTGLVVGVLRLLSVAMAIGMSLPACGLGDDLARSADDALRAGTRSGALDDAALYGDDILRSVPRVAATSNVVLTRMNDLVDEATSSPDLREAVTALLWDVGCDIVTGEVPRELNEVSGWLLQKAASFGLQFADDTVGAVGEGLLDALDSDYNEATERCSELPNSGF